MDVETVAAAARALPGVTEADHHGRRSFRVGGGKVLATVWTEGVLNVLVGEDLAHAVSAQPGVELLWWGKRLSGVRVELASLDPALLDELLHDAWARRAPAALRARQESPPGSWCSAPGEGAEHQRRGTPGRPGRTGHGRWV
jgi:hypothetical protein